MYLILYDLRVVYYFGSPLPEQAFSGAEAAFAFAINPARRNKNSKRTVQ